MARGGPFHPSAPTRAFVFVAFDVLAMSGKEVRRLPLVQRKRLLHAIVPNRSADPWR